MDSAPNDYVLDMPTDTTSNTKTARNKKATSHEPAACQNFPNRRTCRSNDKSVLAAVVIDIHQDRQPELIDHAHDKKDVKRLSGSIGLPKPGKGVRMRLFLFQSYDEQLGLPRLLEKWLPRYSQYISGSLSPVTPFYGSYLSRFVQQEYIDREATVIGQRHILLPHEVSWEAISELMNDLGAGYNLGGWSWPIQKVQNIALFDHCPDTGKCPIGIISARLSASSSPRGYIKPIETSEQLARLAESILSDDSFINCVITKDSDNDILSALLVLDAMRIHTLYSINILKTFVNWGFQLAYVLERWEPRIRAMIWTILNTALWDTEDAIRKVVSIKTAIIRKTKNSRLKEKIENLEKDLKWQRQLANRAMRLEQQYFSVFKEFTAIWESQRVTRLTLLASIFLPLSLASGVLSMQSRLTDLGWRLYDFFGVFCLFAILSFIIYHGVTPQLYHKLNNQFLKRAFNSIVCTWPGMMFSNVFYMKHRWRLTCAHLGGYCNESRPYLIVIFVVGIIASCLYGMLGDASMGLKILGYLTAGIFVLLLLSWFLSIGLACLNPFGVTFWRAVAKAFFPPVALGEVPARIIKSELDMYSAFKDGRDMEIWLDNGRKGSFRHQYPDMAENLDLFQKSPELFLDKSEASLTYRSIRP